VAEAIRTADLRRLLAVIDAARRGEAADGLPREVLERARDWWPATSSRFSSSTRCSSGTTSTRACPPARPTPTPPETFWRQYWDSADCCYPDRTGDLLSVTTISDFYTRQQYHNTGMYADYLGPAGLEAEAMICLSAPAGRDRRLLF
jgi:hypothetical protein